MAFQLGARRKIVPWQRHSAMKMRSRLHQPPIALDAAGEPVAAVVQSCSQFTASDTP